MDEITVFADVTCPFAHVGLTRILAHRDALGPEAAPVHVRAWPLEVVNGAPLTGEELAPKVEALRRDVAPDLFGGFAPDRFPASSLPALAAEHAAYRAGLPQGMAFSLAVRRLLFEEGRDISEPALLAALAARLDLPPATADDRSAVEVDHREGVDRGVLGSPHFFTSSGSFFCPTLDIRHDAAGYHVAFDLSGFELFLAAAFG
jgi:predicted DsbA family dithiol-disulfide isomerase